MADSQEYLIGKLVGQLEGIGDQLDAIQAAVLALGDKHNKSEERIRKLEQYRSHQTGIFATISGLTGVLGGGLMSWLFHK